jgi:flagellar hook-associated protein 3 FlgL
MRVTNRMMTDTLLGNLRDNLERLERAQDQVSSGKRIQRPSDDPAGTGRALDYRASIDAGAQYLRNMDNAESWINAADATLDSVTQAMQRARELAVQGSNDTLGAPQQQAIAAEVNQILDHMVMLGNSSLRGERLFGGLKTDADPFTKVGGPTTTAVTYNGDSGAMLREIDVGQTLQINLPGNAVLGSTFTALINLRDHLEAGDTRTISTTDLADIDGAMDTVLNSRAEAGARINRLDGVRSRQSEAQVRLTDLLSKTEDVDLTAAITEFSTQENVYKAALAAGSKAIQPSLLDYLH